MFRVLMIFHSKCSWSETFIFCGSTWILKQTPHTPQILFLRMQRKGFLLFKKYNPLQLL